MHTVGLTYERNKDNTAMRCINSLNYCTSTIQWISAIDTISIVKGIPVTLSDIADDPSVFETAQVNVLPNAGGLTMSLFSYVAEALLVTVCTIL